MRCCSMHDVILRDPSAHQQQNQPNSQLLSLLTPIQTTRRDNRLRQGSVFILSGRTYARLSVDRLDGHYHRERPRRGRVAYLGRRLCHSAPDRRLCRRRRSANPYLIPSRQITPNASCNRTPTTALIFPILFIHTLS